VRIASALRSRKLVYRWANILFWIGVLFPAPGFIYTGFWGAFSGLSVVGRTIEWSRTLPDPIDARHGLALLVLVLSLCSNVFWMIRMNLDVELTRGFRFLLLGSLANNALIPVLFPEFLRLPGFWFWLVAWCALCWALVELPGTVRAEENPTASEVPTLVWVWLGFLVFWIGVTVVNRIAHAPAEPVGVAPEPAALTGYFNDPGHLFQAGEKDRFDRVLSAFEKETSNQIAVAVYPRVPSGSVEDFTLRTAERSRLGSKGIDNGAVLFVFVAERTARLEVGYGLEGALPDITVVHILDQELVPRFAKGEYADGIDASLAAILQTVRSEYQKTRSPGIASVVWHQVVAAAKRVAREAWPTLRKTDAGSRVGISLFGSLLGVGVWSGFVSVVRIGRWLVVGVWNAAHGRPFGPETAKIDVEAIWDSLKLAAFLVIVIGGVVVVAGGGTFGGAGALARW
jgi:uncharacterized membrane protein YgcG